MYMYMYMYMYPLLLGKYFLIIYQTQLVSLELRVQPSYKTVRKAAKSDNDRWSLDSHIPPLTLVVFPNSIKKGEH